MRHKMCIRDREHSITRRYEAIVYNNFKDDGGTVDAPIGRMENDRKKMAVNYKHGREAVTHYKVLKRLGQYTHIPVSYTHLDVYKRQQPDRTVSLIRIWKCFDNFTVTAV